MQELITPELKQAPHGPNIQILRTPIPPTIDLRVDGVVVSYPTATIDEQGKRHLTEQGKELIAAEKRTIGEIRAQEPHIMQLLAMHGVSYRIAADSKTMSGQGHGKEDPEYHTDTKQVTMVLAPYGVMVWESAAEHEGGHGYNDILAKYSRAALSVYDMRQSMMGFGYAGLNGMSLVIDKISSHPVLAAFYEYDASRIKYSADWPMGMGHFMTADKGGEHLTVAAARDELFSDMMKKNNNYENMLYAGKAGDPNSKTPKKDFIDEKFFNFQRAVRKLNGDIKELYELNPDPTKLDVALHGYMAEFDKFASHPQDFLNSNIVEKLQKKNEEPQVSQLKTSPTPVSMA